MHHLAWISNKCAANDSLRVCLPSQMSPPSIDDQTSYNWWLWNDILASEVSSLLLLLDISSNIKVGTLVCVTGIVWLIWIAVIFGGIRLRRRRSRRGNYVDRASNCLVGRTCPYV
jgi:hypothetical protein